MNPMFLVALLALLVWFGVYFLIVAWLPGGTKKFEWHCRVVTMSHAVLVTALSGWSVFVQGPWPFTEPAGANTVLQEYTSAISLGYFIFDLSWCIYFRTEGAFMLFHHGLSIFGNALVLWRGINGCEMAATLFGTELTNPLLQTRWFLRRSERPVSARTKETIDFAFLALFTFTRIGLASVLLVCYMTHPRPDAIARCGGWAIYLVGWVFWISLVRYAWRKYVLRLPDGGGGRRLATTARSDGLPNDRPTSSSSSNDSRYVKNGSVSVVDDDGESEDAFSENDGSSESRRRTTAEPVDRNASGDTDRAVRQRTLFRNDDVATS